MKQKKNILELKVLIVITKNNCWFHSLPGCLMITTGIVDPLSRVLDKKIYQVSQNGHDMSQGK